MGYRPGDFWRVCDACGFYYRASETRKRWDGLIVCDFDYEERHPQDFVRGVKDRQNVPDPRPEPADIAIGSLQTELAASAAAGATSLTVTSTSGMANSDALGVMLDSGNTQRVTLSNVASATAVTVSPGLLGPATSGNRVIDYTQTSTPEF